ncbi:hypothetical protein F2Q68_00012888 [Brassica cretica]|uniref:Uncharacterized protein n=1 Tax=Brassica cretica TaxID=69181 RepID=A0A8S9HHQ9_BRACR|nr:hypothetical protein F2Q68_00012888 [Brassica cretica]
MIPCSTSNGSFLPPRTASNKIKAKVPPSRAGNGNRLITARFRFSNASEGKVPPSFKQEEYKFREYGSEAEAMKAKCVCFSGQSHKKPIAA